MARRRKKRARRASVRRAPARRAPRKKRRSSRRSKMGQFGWVMGPLAYGAVREKMSKTIDPFLTQRLGFLGNYADEASMILALYGARRFLGRKVPFVTQIAKAGLTIEMARIGEGLVKTGFSLGNSGSSAVSTGGLNMPTIG